MKKYVIEKEKIVILLDNLSFDYIFQSNAEITVHDLNKTELNILSKDSESVIPLCEFLFIPKNSQHMIRRDVNFKSTVLDGESYIEYDYRISNFSNMNGYTINFSKFLNRFIQDDNMKQKLKPKTKKSDVAAYNKLIEALLCDSPINTLSDSEISLLDNIKQKLLYRKNDEAYNLKEKYEKFKVEAVNSNKDYTDKLIALRKEFNEVEKASATSKAKYTATLDEMLDQYNIVTIELTTLKQ